MHKPLHVHRNCISATFVAIVGLTCVWPRTAHTAEVTVYGGAEEVSGSLTILECNRLAIMIDCGAYYPEGEGDADAGNARAASLNEQLPDASTACDYLVWTHGHLDHIGRTPLLVRNGFTGTILTTEGTKAIAPIMLAMQIRYDEARRRNWSWSTESMEHTRDILIVKAHWNPDCAWGRRIAVRNLARFQGTLPDLEAHASEQYAARVSISPCKVCAQSEVEQVMDKVDTVAYDQELRLNEDVSIRLLYAGHIPGSASVMVAEGHGSQARCILFSGDLGNELSRLAPGPKPAPPADFVFVETTYGVERRDGNVSQQNRRFREDVARTVAAGGVVWIPAFALDRTQKILWELTTAQDEGLLDPTVPIYTPSPSGNEITGTYTSNQASGWFAPSVASNLRAFCPTNLIARMPKTLPDGPAIIVSTSGMMDAAFAEQLAPLLRGPGNAVFIVGYQDPYTPGGELKAGNDRVTIAGKQYSVSAHVYQYACFSGHADAREIDHWLSLQKESTTIMLVHGTEKSLEDRAHELATRYRVIVPAQRAEYVIP